MAKLAITTNRIKIWGHGNITTGDPEPIDPNGPQVNGVPTGYPTKRVVLKAWTQNTAGQWIAVWDQSRQSYYPLGPGDELDCLVNNTNLFRVNASAGNQGLSVYMELQTGET